MLGLMKSNNCMLLLHVLQKFYNNAAINNDNNVAILIPFSPFNTEVWNSWVKKSSYEIELGKMMSHFESLTHKFL